MANVHLSNRRRILASLMAVSMILPMAGCKKSKKKEKEGLYSSGKVIQETDPYFTADVKKVNIPVDTGKTVEHVTTSDCTYTGDIAIVTYSISYEYPDEVKEKEKAGVPLNDIPGFDYTEYELNATGIFDKEGNLIKEIDMGVDSIYGVTTDKEGNIHMLYYHYDPTAYSKDMTMDQINQAQTQYWIEVFSSSGESLKRMQLKDVDKKSWFDWKASFAILEDGSYCYSVLGELYIFDQEGKLLHQVTDPGREIQGNILRQDGKNYVLSLLHDPNAGNEYQIKEIDLKTGKLGPGTEAGSLGSFENVIVKEEGVFVNSYSGCFKYDMKTGKTEQVFSWNDTDLDRAQMRDIECTPKSEDEILAVGHKDYMYDYPFLIRLTREKINPHAGKKMLVIGGENVSKVKDLVSFASIYSSKPENAARVVIVDYTDGLGASEDLSETEKKIYLDTLTGAGPDILVNLFDSISFRSDAVMEDMNQYIDGSRGLDRKLYFDNVFRVCETDGALYHIPVRFELEGLIANPDLISNTYGWTYEEFFEAAEKMPEDVSFLEGVLYNGLLELMIGTSLPQFVDYKNKTVDLDNEEMRKILQMVKKFGVTKIPDDEGERFKVVKISEYDRLEGEMDTTDDKFAEGMLAIRVGTVGHSSEIGAKKTHGVENPTFLGYPATKKTGMAVHPTLTMGITAASDSKGPAWDFIRAYLEYETPSGLYPYTTPVRIAEYELESANIMKSVNDLYDQYYKEDPILARLLAYHVSEEDSGEFRELVEGATICTGGDPVIFNIICEEAAGYFAGDRTEDEVLKNIQNRAMTVVKER
ncbi:MAG: carbohydrate ABC transporter substrate-binding protein [Clostridiales bacterium]|nr:carbohydrate ABC transporter substrate-binding protein [Clostridiales bacterium]